MTYIRIHSIYIFFYIFLFTSTKEYSVSGLIQNEISLIEQRGTGYSHRLIASSRTGSKTPCTGLIVERFTLTLRQFFTRFQSPTTKLSARRVCRAYASWLAQKRILARKFIATGRRDVSREKRRRKEVQATTAEGTKRTRSNLVNRRGSLSRKRRESIHGLTPRCNSYPIFQLSARISGVSERKTRTPRTSTEYPSPRLCPVTE